MERVRASLHDFAYMFAVSKCQPETAKGRKRMTSQEKQDVKDVLSDVASGICMVILIVMMVFAVAANQP